MVEPMLVWLQLFGPAAAGERPQRRVEDHHRPVHQVGEALRQGSHARRVKRGLRQLTLQEDRPLQLAALRAHLAEQVGGLHADGQQRGDQVQQLEVLVGERAATFVDRVAHADGLVLDDQRDRQARPGVEQVDEPADQPRVARGVIGQVRAARQEHLDRIAPVPQRHVVGGDPLRVVEPERGLLEHQLRTLRVVQHETSALDVEQLADRPDQGGKRLLVVGGRGHGPADLHQRVNTAFLGFDPHQQPFGGQRSWGIVTTVCREVCGSGTWNMLPTRATLLPKSVVEGAEGGPCTPSTSTPGGR